MKNASLRSAPTPAENSFETSAPDAKRILRPAINLAKKVLPVICPNPNVSITALPMPKITLGCR